MAPADILILLFFNQALVRCAYAIRQAIADILLCLPWFGSIAHSGIKECGLGFGSRQAAVADMPTDEPGPAEPRMVLLALGCRLNAQTCLVEVAAGLRDVLSKRDEAVIEGDGAGRRRGGQQAAISPTRVGRVGGLAKDVGLRVPVGAGVVRDETGPGEVRGNVDAEAVVTLEVLGASIPMGFVRSIAMDERDAQTEFDADATWAPEHKDGMRIESQALFKPLNFIGREAIEIISGHAACLDESRVAPDAKRPAGGKEGQARFCSPIGKRSPLAPVNVGDSDHVGLPATRADRANDAFE